MGASILCLSRHSFHTRRPRKDFQKYHVGNGSKLELNQYGRDRIWNVRDMSDMIIMNQAQSLGARAPGRAWGFGRVLGSRAMGPGLGPGRRFPGAFAIWRRPGPRPRPKAQGPPKAQYPSSGPDPDALDVIDDGDIHHVPDSPNPILVFLNPSSLSPERPCRVLMSQFPRNFRGAIVKLPR